MSTDSEPRLSDDQGIEAFLEGLGYDPDYERIGLFRILASSESEGRAISERVSSALGEHMEALVHHEPDWIVDSWPLADVSWAEYGEEAPVDDAGTPYPYAVVVACPWRAGGTEVFEKRVEGLLDNHGVDVERVGERAWRLRYDVPYKADPSALVQKLKRTLGWWECYGLDFRAEQAGDTITLAIVP